MVWLICVLWQWCYFWRLKEIPALDWRVQRPSEYLLLRQLLRILSPISIIIKRPYRTRHYLNRSDSILMRHLRRLVQTFPLNCRNMRERILLLSLKPCKVVPQILRVLSRPRVIMWPVRRSECLKSVHDTLIGPLSYSLIMIFLRPKIWQDHLLLSPASGPCLHLLLVLVALIQIIVLILLGGCLRGHHLLLVPKGADTRGRALDWIGPLAPTQSWLI